MARDLRLGLNLGYWAGGPPPGAAETVQEADRLGFDSVWTAEAYGSDALTAAGLVGRRDQQIKLGTAIVQISARTPAATAMAAMTLDHLSGGRFILGLGVSGPQVVEGWYGQPFAKPLARTREYIEILRDIWAREGRSPTTGPHYPLPLPGGTGLGKPLKSSVHPLREDIPIYLAAEGPKNIAMAAEMCDGWLPLFYSPHHDGFYREALDRGLARGGAPQPRGLRGRRHGAADRHRRRRGGGRRACARCTPCTSAGWAQGDQLPRQRRDPDGLRGRGREDPGAVSGRPQGRGGRRDAHAGWSSSSR